MGSANDRTNLAVMSWTTRHRDIIMVCSAVAGYQFTQHAIAWLLFLAPLRG